MFSLLENESPQNPLLYKRNRYARQITTLLTIMSFVLILYNYSTGNYKSIISNLIATFLFPLFYYISLRRQLLGFILSATFLQILITIQANFLAPNRQLEFIFGLFTIVLPLFFEKRWLWYFLITNAFLFYLPWLRGVHDQLFIFQFAFFLIIFILVNSFIQENNKSLKIDHPNEIDNQREKLIDSNLLVKTEPNSTKSEIIWIKKVEEIAQRELKNGQFSLGDISKELHIGERQVQRRIKKITGLTPSKYFREIKLLAALNYLESAQFETVAEVAYAVGFDTPSYFSKIFEQRFGKRPISFLK